jgi:hypothetical protein
VFASAIDPDIFGLDVVTGGQTHKAVGDIFVGGKFFTKVERHIEFFDEPRL